MPIFEYICKECNHPFEALVYGKDKAECPKCHSRKPGTATVGFCGGGHGIVQRTVVGRPLRQLRRLARPGRLLVAGHGLTPGSRIGRSQARLPL